MEKMPCEHEDSPPAESDALWRTNPDKTLIWDPWFELLRLSL